MKSGEKFGGYDSGNNAPSDPAVTEQLQFLEIYNEIQATLGGLVEGSGNFTSATKAMRRTKLHSLIAQLGLDPKDPSSLAKISDLKADLTFRATHPQPKLDVPEVQYFESRIRETIADQLTFGDPYAAKSAQSGGATLLDIADYAYTDWRDVQTRNHLTTPKYIRGIATVMADPVAYHIQFIGRTSMDHLAVAENWEVQNGRHRTLAARCLGTNYITESGMTQWVPVEVGTH